MAYEGKNNKLCLLEHFLCILIPVVFLYCIDPAISHYVQIKLWVKLIIYIISATTIYLLLLRNITSIREEYDEKSQTSRFQGIDLLRSVAVIMVIILHYLIGVGYYNEPSGTRHFYVLSLIRWLSMSSCPIFMMISGFLIGKRKIERKHYIKTLKLARNYFTIIMIFFLINPNTFSIEAMKKYVNFSELWYMDMYIGLALLAPFLNRLYDALSKNEKELLIVILVLVSSFWTVTQKWTTSYWSALYPFLYYYLGRYIHEQKIHLNKKSILVLLVFMVTTVSFYSQYIKYGQPFDWNENFGGYSSGYNALPVVIIATACFLLLYDIEITNKAIYRILQEISSVSLEIYISSALIIGPRIREMIWSLMLPVSKEVQMIIIVPCELGGAYICGVMVKYLWTLLTKCKAKICNKKNS